MKFWSCTEFWILSEWLTFQADSVHCSSYQSHCHWSRLNPAYLNLGPPRPLNVKHVIFDKIIDVISFILVNLSLFGHESRTDFIWLNKDFNMSKIFKKITFDAKSWPTNLPYLKIEINPLTIWNINAG